MEAIKNISKVLARKFGKSHHGELTYQSEVVKPFLVELRTGYHGYSCCYSEPVEAMGKRTLGIYAMEDRDGSDVVIVRITWTPVDVERFYNWNRIEDGSSGYVSHFDLIKHEHFRNIDDAIAFVRDHWEGAEEESDLMSALGIAKELYATEWRTW